MRQILAFLLFLGLLGGSLYWAFGKKKANHQVRGGRARPDAASNIATSDDHGFFYESIGTAPNAAPDTEPAATGVPSDLFTIELMVFDQRDLAESTVASMQAQGLDAYYTPLNHGGRVVYRVRRGLYPTQDEAQKAALALRQQGQGGAAVVKLQ